MTPHEAADVGVSEKPMTGEITPLRWYVVQGYPPRLQWMERTMPPQWHDVPVAVESEPGLTSAEQRAQGARCPCRGSDDYCPCQNVPDDETLKARREMK